MPEQKGAIQFAPSLTLFGLRVDRFILHSFHATPDTRAAAGRNLVTVGVEDLKRNCIGEFVTVVTDLDDPREPIRIGCEYNRGMPPDLDVYVASRARDKTTIDRFCTDYVN